MAEVLGLISGGIAVGQLGGAVAGGALKLKKLLDRIENVPNDIAEMVEDLQMLDPLICTLQNQLGQDASSKAPWSNPQAIVGAENCRSALVKLKNLVDEVDKNINNASGKFKRKVVAVKVILKDDDIKRLERKLERTIERLRLAVLCYLIASASANNQTTQTILEATTSIQEITTTITQEISTRPLNDDRYQRRREEDYPKATRLVQQRSLVRVNNLGPTYFGRISIAYSEEHQTRSVVFQPPSWLTSHVWEVQTQSSYGGWQWVTRHYNIRPRSSPIFKLVRRGDLEGVLDALVRREAHPYDRDEKGLSLLHYACSAAVKNWPTHAKLCEKLLEFGLDECIDEKVGSARSPREDVISSVLLPGRDSTYQWSEAMMFIRQTFEPVPASQALQEYGGLLELFDRSAPESLSEKATYSLLCRGDTFKESESFTWFQKRFAPKYYTLPLQTRLKAACNAIMNGNEDLDLKVAKLLINEDMSLTTQDLEVSHTEGISILHLVAAQYGIWQRKALEVPSDYLRIAARYKEFLREVISLTAPERLCLAQPTTMLDTGDLATPLQSFLIGAACLHIPITRIGWQKTLLTLEAMLVEWLEILRDARIDLLEYGKTEQAILSAHKTDSSLHWSQNFSLKTLSEFDDSSSGISVVHFVRNEIPACLADITVGKDIRDWAIRLEIDTEQLVGEFWGNISESTQDIATQCCAEEQMDRSASAAYQIPGSWVD